MTTSYHSAIATGAAANASTFNTPMGQLDAAIAALHGGSTITDDLLIAWAQAEAYTIASASYDSDGVLTSATVSWPDSSSGTLTVTSKNAVWMAVDAYTVTHSDSGKTVTQAAVTRDSDGNITAQPALTVA